jgi:predicted kinase
MPTKIPTLIVVRGLQGSGKTTRAKAWVAKDPTNRARVNRDDLRGMAHDGVWLGRETERQIVAIRDAAIRALLRRGVDVVCDDTNLPSRVVRELRRLATLVGAQFVVWDMTDVPLNTCIERDAAREKPIGAEVIKDAHSRYLAGQVYPLPIADESEPEETQAPQQYVPREGTPRAIIVDIDGTLAKMGDRSPYDEAKVSEDQPNQPVIEVVKTMHRAGNDVIVCSGRTESCREETEHWLGVNLGISFVALHMRASGDYRRDATIKREIFDKHIRDHYNIIGVFDDRNQVVEMWRSLGLTVFQVADGDF